MKRFLIFTGIAIAILILLGWGVMMYMKSQTKSFSPEEEIVFNDGALAIKLFYNRPYKKGREIFGKLVPFDSVWRTGANEATTFETNQDLNIEGKVLPKGKYSLWTIPNPGSWTIIFNNEYGQWGVNSDGAANRDPARDVLSVTVPAVVQDREFEQFTINFEKVGEENEMVLIWDKTLVAMPFSH